ncbi:hypothetical protein ACP4OV_031918 [Aristida adscensionis]
MSPPPGSLDPASSFAGVRGHVIGETAIHPKRPAASIACSSKHRRRTVHQAAAAAAVDSYSWYSLPEDLVRLIGWRVLAGDLLDYVRFRATCRHWRSATDHPRGRGILDPRFHPRRWMMVPEGHGLHPGHGKLHGCARFFNLSTGSFVRVRLPLFRDHCVLDSVDGVLLLQRDHDTAVRLLHPFTGDIAELPPLATLLDCEDQPVPGADGDARKLSYLRNVLAASINVSTNGAITVMMSLSGLLRLAFATSEDRRWRVSSGKMPLLECDSEILVAASSRKNTSHFSVYRLADLIVGRIVPVTSVGGNALFLYNRTLSVNSKALPNIVGDTIIYFDSKELYLAQYHLSSGTLSQAADGRPRNNFVPSPCTIIYHIFTCCCRAQWNKGQIIGQGKRKTSWPAKGKWRDGAKILGLRLSVAFE